jgi:deazaflavin-dependent oxidoreductase (nitroreductase family)
MTDWNTQIIDEFRANDGVVGGMFEGATLLILHSTGAKTGNQRLAPLMYQANNGGYAIFASKAGATDNPDWFYNLKANPEASIEVGTDTVEVTARVLGDDERDPIWDAQKKAYPQFAGYEKTSDGRKIPVVLLTTRP